MRGDRPLSGTAKVGPIPFTPHARGSTLRRNGDILRRGVYPACAGIDPDTIGQSLEPGGLPRMRGDRP